MNSKKESYDIEFEATIAKHKRINIPKAFFQPIAGDKVKVRIVKEEVSA